jgi:hypothetical protein
MAQHPPKAGRPSEAKARENESQTRSYIRDPTWMRAQAVEAAFTGLWASAHRRRRGPLDTS